MIEPTAEDEAMHGPYALFAVFLSELSRANPDCDPTVEYTHYELIDAYLGWSAGDTEPWGLPGRSPLTMPSGG